MKNILLTLLAFVLVAILTPVGVMFAFCNNSKSVYFYNFAIALDQLGNVACQHLFNATLIKKDSRFRFGNPDQTVSYVIAINQAFNNLTKTGLFFAKLLNWFDENHLQKAIEHEKKNSIFESN